MACNPQKVKEALTKAFNEVDTDKSGTVSAQEIERILVSYYKQSGKPCDNAKIKSEAESFLRDVDTNRDGKIELNEFLKYFEQFCK